MWPAGIHRFGARQIKKRLMEILFLPVKSIRQEHGFHKTSKKDENRTYGSTLATFGWRTKICLAGRHISVIFASGGANVSYAGPQCFGPFFPLQPAGRPPQNERSRGLPAARTPLPGCQHAVGHHAWMPSCGTALGCHGADCGKPAPIILAKSTAAPDRRRAAPRRIAAHARLPASSHAHGSADTRLSGRLPRGGAPSRRR